jgi:hypothetical protein
MPIKIILSRAASPVCLPELAGLLAGLPLMPNRGRCVSELIRYLQGADEGPCAKINHLGVLMLVAYLQE